jgi:dynein heavy chain
MTQESNIKSAEVNTIVEQMTKQSADIKVKKEAAQKQKIYIDNESEKVKAEAAICDQIAAEAQAQLDLATPALEEAQRSVAGLDKKAINEIKAYNNPPKEVAKVMGAVMTYLKEGTTWTDIRKVMNDPKFINRIIDFDMDNIPDATIKKI